jgi:chromosome segregation ATPase
MAFKIGKKDRARLDEVRDKIAAQGGQVEARVAELNEAVEAARAKLEDEVNTYNELVQEAGSIVEDIHRELESEYDDKSDRWKESERGECVQSWLQELENFGNEMSEAEMPEIEEVSIDLPDPEVIDNLQDEPSC